ncbi:MAG: Sir2 family NAD-dependent protein deacetylase [Rikenellaceae bacterium]
MKKVVVFTGAGVSADSGIATFRSSDGLWANYRIEDVCTPTALATNRNVVIEFYNKRRREMLEKSPNAGHYAIAELEKYFEVEVITQNVDNLHERAGSSSVLHLHGELTKLRSQRDPKLIYHIDGWEQYMDDRAPNGDLLRPHIVFFGEDVPLFTQATKITATADILIVVGTSLAVYPAASLLHYAQPQTPIYLVDPQLPNCDLIKNKIYHIASRSAEGLPKLVDLLKNL